VVKVQVNDQFLTHNQNALTKSRASLSNPRALGKTNVWDPMHYMLPIYRACPHIRTFIYLLCNKDDLTRASVCTNDVFVAFVANYVEVLA